MPLSRIEADLAALAARDRARTLATRAGVDFASNDYLGLAGSPELAAAARAALDRGVPVGSGGSRLLRGNHAEHEALEAEAAAFFGAERALFLGGGYPANLALIATLADRADLIVWDALSHASTREGLRLARAETAEARHNDADHVAALIAAWRARGGRGQPWIAVESVYSMEGTRGALADFAAIVRRHDGFLIVDEAHATGVFGARGEGLAHGLGLGERLVALHTCGKALGASGALVTAAAVVIDLLINRARPFIYATAPSPLMAAVVRAALPLAAEPARRAALHASIARLGERLAPLGIAATGTPIQPVILGADARALAVAARLRDAGFDVRAIRPPTVPEGSARLRLSVTLNARPADIDALAGALEEALCPA